MYSLTHCVCVCVIKIKRKKKERKRKRKKKDYSTQSSQVVSNPSTNRARRGLTSLIGREVVLSSWYGRNQCYFLPFYFLLRSHKRKCYIKSERNPITHSLTHTFTVVCVCVSENRFFLYWKSERLQTKTVCTNKTQAQMNKWIYD